MLFVGVDWAEDHHDVCVMADDGRVLGQRRVPDAERQRHAIRESQPRTAVERKISSISAAVVGEAEGATGFAEHGPMRAEPKVPLHDDRNPRVVAGPVGAEPAGPSIGASRKCGSASNT